MGQAVAAAVAFRTTFDALHAPVYFAPETQQRLAAVGLKPGSMTYFASRSAAMGAVGPGTVAATFYSFSPSLIAHFVPRVWTLATPETVLEARLAAVDEVYRRQDSADLADFLDAPLGLGRAAGRAPGVQVAENH
ncbi:hypothetical protein ABT279_36120, partial [Amycolatopsis sp. NPDC000673]